MGVLQGIFNSYILVGFVVGNYFITNNVGDLSNGDILVVLFNVVPVLFAVGDIGNKSKDIIEATQHLGNLVEIIEWQDSVSYLPRPLKDLTKMDISLTNVSFTYKLEEGTEIRVINGLSSDFE